jgi:hypothetical protein
VYCYIENDTTGQPIRWLFLTKSAPLLPTLSVALTDVLFQSSLYMLLEAQTKFSTFHIPKAFFNLHTCLVNRYALFSECTVIWQRRYRKPGLFAQRSAVSGQRGFW